MNVDEVYELIAPSKDNLIKIAKAIRTDFEAILGYYIVFEKLSVEQALLKVSKDIVEAYKDKEELWEQVKQDLQIG